MGKRKAALALILAALILGGCGQKKEEPVEPAPTEAPARSVIPQARGRLADGVGALMAPYGEILEQAARKSGDSLAFAIPGDILNQMALDAEAAGADAREGRWRFTRRETGDYTYESTAWDAMDQYGQGADVTPDPADETPLDSQLTGDYAVAGGGLFERERAYDAAEDLSGGTVIFTDTLNGQITGSELFRFCVRGGELIFADAALDAAVREGDTGGQPGYLAAVGVLRPDGLETVEYRVAGLDQLPDPETLDWPRFLLTISPLSRVSLQKE